MLTLSSVVTESSAGTSILWSLGWGDLSLASSTFTSSWAAREEVPLATITRMLNGIMIVRVNFKS